MPWFKRSAATRGLVADVEERQSPLPYENLILTYAALEMQKEANEATARYIASFGRLPWPERRALARLNIDADALYIEDWGHAA